ncbi:MAG: AAA family ATPase [Microbacteriaceae bacterium]|jgi:ABC-type multidrug transport system ATPase subunit|nr:AAA family ATPase [Microbacteriaceae bacterium]
MDSIIHARDLQLTSRRGQVFGPLDLDLGHGISVVHGPMGSGRTSLLLTLAGRMRLGSATELTVLGEPLPARSRKVQMRTGIAGFAPLDDLDDSVTVASTIRERKAWLSPWWKFIREPDQDEVDAVCALAFNGRTPKGPTRIWELNDVDQLLLKISVALMAHPDLLFIDSIEQIQEPDGREFVWRRLDTLVDAGIDVVVAAASTDISNWGVLRHTPTTAEIPNHSLVSQEF